LWGVEVTEWLAKYDRTECQILHDIQRVYLATRSKKENQKKKRTTKQQ
jgi:hypothetical protein